MRLGYYEVEDSRIISGSSKNYPVSMIASYSNDFVLQAFDGEKIVASGMLEKVEPLDGKDSYYRLVIGYFDSYIDRRKQEFIKVEGLS